MKLIDNAGKPVSLEGIDPKIATALEQAFGGITHQFSAAMSATLKPFETKITELNQTIEGLPKKDDSKTTETPKPGDASTTTSSPELKAILDAVNGLSTRMEEVETKSVAEREAKTSQSLTAAYIEKNHPNLKGKDSILGRIASKKPKNEDEVKAALEDERKFLASVTNEDQVTKLFSADPVAEGGKGGQVDDKEAQIKSKIDAINSELPKS